MARLILILVSLTSLASGYSIGFLYSGGTFTPITDPFAPFNTQAYGINNAGQIVGTFGDATGGHGFVDVGGIFITIDDPLAMPIVGGTGLSGINDAGHIVGGFSGSAGGLGLLYVDGTFTTISDPLDPSFTSAQGINDADQIVGRVDFSDGFLYTGGAFLTIRDPSETGPATPNGINNAGQIVGNFTDASGVHGFLDVGGNFTPIDDPLAFMPNGTDALGINDRGEIVGSYIDAHVHFNGFLDTNGVFTTIDYPGADSTVLEGINDAGQIVGIAGITTPEPGTLAMICAVLLGVAVYLLRKTLCGAAWQY